MDGIFFHDNTSVENEFKLLESRFKGTANSSAEVIATTCTNIAEVADRIVAIESGMDELKQHVAAGIAGQATGQAGPAHHRIHTPYHPAQLNRDEWPSLHQAHRPPQNGLSQPGQSIDADLIDLDAPANPQPAVQSPFSDQIPQAEMIKTVVGPVKSVFLDSSNLENACRPQQFQACRTPTTAFRQVPKTALECFRHLIVALLNLQTQMSLLIGKPTAMSTGHKSRHLEDRIWDRTFLM